MARIVELRSDIFQIRSERPGSHVYLVKGTAKNILIDTGTHANYPNLVECLAQAGLAPEDIHLIVLTHEHFDHIGASAFFARKAIIAAHAHAANKIDLHDDFVMMSKYMDGAAQAFRADLWLQEQTQIDLGNYKITVMHTPGHCSGCICLYEPNQRVLFTGDTVLAGGVLSGILGSGNISDYINSLERLNALRIDEFFPGHGRVSYSPAEDLAKALENSKLLMEESKALFDAIDTKSTYEGYFAALRKQPPPKVAKTA
ncbi:MAG: MBL fold metallo-hydrolase [Syntrophobacteraceae bacterium]